jgi:hypothetical protein
VGEKAANLLNEFDKLSALEKESLAVEIIAHAQAQGVPLPLIFRQVLGRAEEPNPPLSPSERVKALREWAASHPLTPPLSDEAISRENLYSDRG